jgi:hypothetical protein
LAVLDGLLAWAHFAKTTDILVLNEFSFSKWLMGSSFAKTGSGTADRCRSGDRCAVRASPRKSISTASRPTIANWHADNTANQSASARSASSLSLFPPRITRSISGWHRPEVDHCCQPRGLRNVSTTLIQPGSEFKLNSTRRVGRFFGWASPATTGRGPLRIGTSSCVGPGGVT